MNFEAGDLVESKYTGNIWKVLQNKGKNRIECESIKIVSNGWEVGMVAEFYSTAFKLLKTYNHPNHPNTKIFK